MNQIHEHLNVTGSVREKNIGDKGKGGRERNKSGGGRIIKGKGSSPMEWTIKYTQRTYISIISVDPDIYAYEVYMYMFKIYTDTFYKNMWMHINFFAHIIVNNHWLFM